MLGWRRHSGEGDAEPTWTRVRGDGPAVHPARARGRWKYAGVSTDLQTIAYPAPGARPSRREPDAIAPHVIVLFGATGDLAKRKLLPGMAYLVQSALAPKIRVVGTSLEDMTDDEFRALTKEAVDSFGSHKLTDEQ